MVLASGFKSKLSRIEKLGTLKRVNSGKLREITIKHAFTVVKAWLRTRSGIIHPILYGVTIFFYYSSSVRQVTDAI